MTMYIKDTLKASISGNANTATTLQTARTINGTSFNGSANITTTNWGTARNIYVADSDATNTGAAVSVNGSANATLKLPATIKASLSGNATTATTLQTTRTINGTNFNGSANITTANWGTARTITIGGTGKSVNGSGNVSWTLAEIGAFSSSGGNITGSISLTTDNTGITGVCGGGTDQWTIVGGGTDDNGYLEIRTRDNGNEPIYVRQYDANGLVRTAALLDGNGATSFPGLISEGGTKLTDKYAAKSHGHNEIWVKDAPFSSSNDTTANWGGQGVSVSWYPDGTTITNKPNTWGFIFNIGRGTEVHQLWLTQASGSMFHRGGNGSGWSGSWREVLDSSNYSSYAAPASHSHSYVPLSGGTLSGPIQVSGESKFHNGSYSDPWSGTGCAIKATGHIAATGVIRANQYLQVGGTPLSIQSGAPSCGGVWIQI